MFRVFFNQNSLQYNLLLFCIITGSEVEESVPEKPPSPSKHHEITISGENPNITSQRFWALLKIRFLTRFRNPSALIFQMLIPVILVIIGCVVSKEGTPEDVSQTKPVQMKPVYVVPTEAPFLAVDSAGNIYFILDLSCHMRYIETHKIITIIITVYTRR